MGVAGGKPAGAAAGSGIAGSAGEAAITIGADAASPGSGDSAAIVVNTAAIKLAEASAPLETTAHNPWCHTRPTTRRIRRHDSVPGRPLHAAADLSLLIPRNNDWPPSQTRGETGR
jgi:hypothetical protein